jgi:hypothetical protein
MISSKAKRLPYSQKSVYSDSSIQPIVNFVMNFKIVLIVTIELIKAHHQRDLSLPERAVFILDIKTLFESNYPTVITPLRPVSAYPFPATVSGYTVTSHARTVNQHGCPVAVHAYTVTVQACSITGHPCKTTGDGSAITEDECAVDKTNLLKTMNGGGV